MTKPMNEEAEVLPLSRKTRVRDIEANAPQTIEATAAEREAIKILLDLVDLKNLRFDYRLRCGSDGRVYLSGQVKADVSQTCVISLEPVEARVDTPVEMEFWPETPIADLERRTDDPGQAGLLDWPEAIVDGNLDLGRVAYETLATALDPYPRKEGATFQWSQGAGATEARAGPFAALEQLKKR